MCPGAARLADIDSGHQCWPPRPNIQGAPTVMINGRPAHRLTDAWPPHCCPLLGCHPGILATASSTVFSGSLPQGRIGDLVGCGSGMVITGSMDVQVGG